MAPETPQNPVQVYEQRLDVHGPEAAFNEDGVDLSQIRESLDMTLRERLERLQNWVSSLAKVKVIRGSRETSRSENLKSLGSACDQTNLGLF